MRHWLWCSALLLACSSAEDPPPETPRGNGCGHAHNDYEHDEPLTDALGRGFCSIEADIWLVGGELLVAHDLDETDPARTLQSLYLDPLRAMNDEGAIEHFGEGPLTLLIDVKSDATPTYAALHDVLSGYADVLTVFEAGVETSGAVTAVVSGGRDRAAMEAQDIRFAAMDGRLDDLGGGAPTTLIPLISQSWFQRFVWLGMDEIPAEEAAELASILEQAHGEGRRIRFWATPDQANAWETLLDAGVDFINTDDLAGFSLFYSGYRRP